MPPNWEIRVDETGRTFYVDHGNRLMTWRRPSVNPTPHPTPQTATSAMLDELLRRETRTFGQSVGSRNRGGAGPVAKSPPLAAIEEADDPPHGRRAVPESDGHDLSSQTGLVSAGDAGELRCEVSRGAIVRHVFLPPCHFGVPSGFCSSVSAATVTRLCRNRPVRSPRVTAFWTLSPPPFLQSKAPGIECITVVDVSEIDNLAVTSHSLPCVVARHAVGTQSTAVAPRRMSKQATRRILNCLYLLGFLCFTVILPPIPRGRVEDPSALLVDPADPEAPAAALRSPSAELALPQQPPRSVSSSPHSPALKTRSFIGFRCAYRCWSRVETRAVLLM